jgi:hypothetical protein
MLSQTRIKELEKDIEAAEDDLLLEGADIPKRPVHRGPSSIERIGSLEAHLGKLKKLVGTGHWAGHPSCHGSKQRKSEPAASATPALATAAATALKTLIAAPKPTPVAADPRAAMPEKFRAILDNKRPSIGRAEFDALSHEQRNAWFSAGGTLHDDPPAPNRKAKAAPTPKPELEVFMARQEFETLSHSDRRTFLITVGGKLTDEPVRANISAARFKACMKAAK